MHALKKKKENSLEGLRVGHKALLQHFIQGAFTVPIENFILNYI